MQYDKIDVAEGIDVNKTSASKECELCHYWFFKDVGYKNMFVMDIMILTMTNPLKDIAILSTKGATFRCILTAISKNETLKRLNNSVTRDRGIL